MKVQLQQKQLVFAQKSLIKIIQKNICFSSCNPQTIDLIKTRAEPFGLELIIGDEKDDFKKLKIKLVCGVISYPGTLGEIKILVKL